MSSPTPTLGRIVLYTLNQGDADMINASSTSANTAQVGDVYPAMIVRVFSGQVVNLQVFYDGAGSYWATSRVEGDPAEEQHGRWNWPPRV